MLYLSSTSNHNCKRLNVRNTIVVLYLSSTSNHNPLEESALGDYVVLYLSSTSNHNRFEILLCNLLVVLYLSSTSNHNIFTVIFSPRLVVLYLSSTSNHNIAELASQTSRLCYIFLLHQTTTASLFSRTILCCVISFFYIKPQRAYAPLSLCYVVLYLSSTSNHNRAGFPDFIFLLCYIFLLHQTTTDWNRFVRDALLCYIFLLHQTPTEKITKVEIFRCVISFFYIKPQL